MNEFNDDRPLTSDEAQEFLKLEPGAFTRLVNSGELPFRKIGRQNYFRKADLVEWFNKQFDPMTPKAVKTRKAG